MCTIAEVIKAADFRSLMKFSVIIIEFRKM